MSLEQLNIRLARYFPHFYQEFQNIFFKTKLFYNFECLILSPFDLIFLCTGNGSVKAMLEKAAGLENWERNLRLGDAYFPTSAKGSPHNSNIVKRRKC